MEEDEDEDEMMDLGEEEGLDGAFLASLDETGIRRLVHDLFQ